MIKDPLATANSKSPFDRDVIVVANGFSCFEQIVDGSRCDDRQVLHPVEVIEMCLL